MDRPTYEPARTTHPLTRADLVQLLAPYRSYGIVKPSGELLLPSDVALRLLDDLERVAVPIMGLDGWRWIDQARGWVVQALAIDLTVADAILHGEHPATASAAVIRAYITEQLPPDTPLVSFTLDIPPEWEPCITP